MEGSLIFLRGDLPSSETILRLTMFHHLARLFLIPNITHPSPHTPYLHLSLPTKPTHLQVPPHLSLKLLIRRSGILHPIQIGTTSSSSFDDDGTVDGRRVGIILKGVGREDGGCACMRSFFVVVAITDVVLTVGSGRGHTRARARA